MEETTSADVVIPSTAADPKSRSKKRGGKNRQARRENFLYSKNKQLESSRFRQEDAKSLSVPPELFVPVVNFPVAVSITLYFPLIFCMRVLDWIMRTLPGAPQIERRTYLVAMRALMTSKVVQAHKMNKCPKGFANYYLSNVPSAKVRAVDTYLRTVPTPIRRLIDCIGAFKIGVTDYLPFLLRSRSYPDRSLPALDGTYTDKEQTIPTGSMAPVTPQKRRRVQQRDDDAVELPDRVLHFPWGDLDPYEGLPASLPDPDDPLLKTYFEWSQSLKRFLAMHEVQIMSGVGHSTQVVRSSGDHQDTWNLWSYIASGDVDFALSHYGLGESRTTVPSTLPEIPDLLSVSSAVIYPELRLTEDLRSFQLSTAQI